MTATPAPALTAAEQQKPICGAVALRGGERAVQRGEIGDAQIGHCNRPVERDGDLCWDHQATPQELAAAFAEKIKRGSVREPNGCWTWTRSLTSDGYARVIYKGRHVMGHRATYEERFGPIPKGLEIDHLCRNRACVNPDHFEAVTGRVNTLRGNTITAMNARKTHCPQGHPYDEANTRYNSTGRKRACRACDRDRAKRKSAALATQAGDGAR